MASRTAKARFHVMYYVTSQWVDYYKTGRTYMQACEEADELQGRFPACQVKVVHEKALSSLK